MEINTHSDIVINAVDHPFVTLSEDPFVKNLWYNDTINSFFNLTRNGFKLIELNKKDTLLLKKAVTERLDAIKNSEGPKFYIGTDTYDVNNLVYSLIRKHNDNVDVVLFKTMRNKVEFKEEVENLAKYFNAKCYEEH